MVPKKMETPKSNDSFLTTNIIITPKKQKNKRFPCFFENIFFIFFYGQWTGTRMDGMDIMDTNGHVFYGHHGHLQQVTFFCARPFVHQTSSPSRPFCPCCPLKTHILSFE